MAPEQIMTPEERIHRLNHANKNCRQMLGAVDRKLAEALRCLEDGRHEECEALLGQLKQALPEAIKVIEHDD
ncbi:hypothetical protein T8S45_09965 [Blastomonas marina]|uniref:hypothetical protein n=1 Tax=Blastomonas marina TaxID=1867408 RepID=UPI002AC936C4|nr:hypothetical protein [Blastomonas marina]WPZ03164.1 hypothetical protein T8S45_09965 [Blastomonas marina]